MGHAVEHIIPGWLQREWNLTSNQFSPTHYNIEGDVVSTRAHNFAALVTGRVAKYATKAGCPNWKCNVAP
jgi:5-enolpyruvylshikimate-3-phosphate synthase